MPLIKEDDLIKLYSELDKLKEDNYNLERRFVQLKLKSNKIHGQRKRNIFISILIFISLVFSTLYFYNKQLDHITLINKEKSEQFVLLDSIKQLRSNGVLDKTNLNVVYSIQLGVFKDLNIEFDNQENTNFKKIETKNGNIYQIGNFVTYKNANTFKKQINKIGFNDVILVAYNKNSKKITLKEALVLSKEENVLNE